MPYQAKSLPTHLLKNITKLTIKYRFQEISTDKQQTSLDGINEAKIGLKEMKENPLINVLQGI